MEKKDYKPLYILFHFAGRNLQESVQRAETYETGYCEDKCYHDQNNPGHSRNYSGQIEDYYYGGQRQSYDPVNRTHILFHPTPPFHINLVLLPISWEKGVQGSRVQGFKRLFSRQISIARTSGIMHPVMLGHMGTVMPFAVIST